MSLQKSSLVGDDFTKALKKEPSRRSTMDLQTLFYTLRALDCLALLDDNVLYTICTYCTYSMRSANDILYCRGEVVSSWYILISGSVFIDGSMFLPIVSFGRRSPSQSRRTNECLILESSEMIVIDYIDYSPVPRSIGSISSNRNSQSSDTSSAYSGSDTIGSLRSDDMDLSGLVEANVDSDDEDDLADSMEELTVRDAVRECLEKDPAERTEHDIHVLLEFTQHLNAFNDLTITTRRALCQVMVFAVVEKAGTIVLNDNEELDSWSVLVHGSVEIRDSSGTTITLSAGDSFGLPPTLDKQYFQGEMRTTCDDCQFVCVTQEDYYRIQKQGLDNQTHHHRDSKLVLITETKTENSRIVHVIIRGTENELMEQLVTMEHPSSDPTYVEDYLLTHRVFESSEKLARKLIEWFNDVALRDRVTRVMLLWVNNHFVDFEGDTHLMAELVRFHSLLEATQDEMMGQLRLLQIACSAKSRSRTLTLSRASRDDPLPFNIMGGADSGYGIYVNSVEGNIHLRPGDEILEVNNICFKEISLGKGYEILKNATHLCLVVKCNFMGYYECLHSKIPLTPRNPLPMPPTQAITLKPNKSKKERLFDKLIKGFLPKNGLDVVDSMIEQSTNKIDYPENVLKVYRSDQSFKYFLVNRETTAREVVMLALQEFVDLNTSNSRDFALFQVSAPGSVLKQGRLPDTLDSLAERLPLGSRYYIKNPSSSEQLLPDEQLPELAREGEVSLLTLSPSALALQLTLSDYSIFRQIEMTEYIDDLFDIKTSYGTPNLTNFANLVNRETFWVVTEILKEGNVNKRVGIIKRFIKIATQCRECRNFNSMFNIISGLGHSSVSRLKSTWEKVSGKWKRCFNEMQELMDPSRNMGKYRTILSQSFGQTPMIPFYPVVKKDLTFIDLGNSTHLDSLVNFEKMRMISKEIRGLVQMSAAPFDTSSQPTMAAMNQLVSKGNNLTTTTGKRRKKTTGPVNIKKMYEEMHMVRKVKAYLTKLEVISDETELFNLSFTVEPNPMEPVKYKTGTIQRRPGSPTLSTSSSASSESKKKFGTGSPGSYQKLMSLSEAKTKVYRGKSNVSTESGSSNSVIITSTTTTAITQPSPIMGVRKPSVDTIRASTDSARLLLSIESSSVLPGKS